MIKQNKEFRLKEWIYQTPFRVKNRIVFVDVVLDFDKKQFDVFSGKHFIGSGEFKKNRPTGTVVNKIVKNFIKDNEIK